ncbi:MAG: S8 family serine peptidase [Bdellovibrionota bacterium]
MARNVSSTSLLTLAFVTLGLCLPVQAKPKSVPGEIIVKLKGKSKTLQAQAFIGKAVSEKSMSLKGSWSGLNMHHFALKAGESVDQAIADLQADPDVEYAEPNYIFDKQSAGPEGEAVAMSDVQVSAAESSSAFTQTSAPIQLTNAWAQGTSGLGTPVVAVIDTGLDLAHSVFTGSNAIWSNTDEIAGNGVDDDNNGYIDDTVGWNFVANTNSPQDDDGHGTHVSGIVLGATQDITAVTLAQAKIKIMPLKFLDAHGSGSTADAVKAIYYGVNNGATVLSNSWGGGGFSNSLLTAIAYAYDKKVIFLAAAGNASSNNDAAPTYPANYSVPNIVSVAATSDIDGFASFSNYGKTSVHVGSPGVSIWSTLPGNMYGRQSGTSMATPFVSGLAALMVRENPSMSAYQVKNLIFGSSQVISSLTNRTTTQARINAYNAMVSAKAATADASQPAYDASAARSPASVEGEQVAGCGLVAKAVYDGAGGSGPSGPFRNLMFFAVLAILVAPILVSVVLRNREPAHRRRHTRYQIDSSVTMKIGDRELVGQVSSISLGGVQVNTEAWLENGGLVTMSIRSPDGTDQIDVQGKVVWSEEKKRYGVAFDNAQENTVAAISRWTQSLMRL